jgi:hypothetical protein
LTWNFWSVNILSWESPWGEKVNETRPRGQMSTSGTVPLPGHTTHTHWGLEPPLPSIFISRRSAWPKNAYIKNPSTIAKRGSRETRNSKIEDFPAKIGGRKRCRSHPRTLLHPLRCQHHHHRHEEGAVHLYNMGL